MVIESIRLSILRHQAWIYPFIRAVLRLRSSVDGCSFAALIGLRGMPRLLLLMLVSSNECLLR